MDHKKTVFHKLNSLHHKEGFLLRKEPVRNKIDSKIEMSYLTIDL
jgi:hypothetical protein